MYSGGDGGGGVVMVAVTGHRYASASPRASHRETKSSGSWGTEAAVVSKGWVSGA